MNAFLLAAAEAEAPASPGFLESLKSITFSWFDLVVAALLVVGFIHGRKRGMSGELVDLMAALAMMVVAGEYYPPVSAFLTRFTNLAMPWANLLSYGAIIFAVFSIIGVVKSKMGSKLVSGDLFGRGEYYLGAFAGLVRYFCYFVVALSVINSKTVSVAEAEAAAAAQEKEFGSSFFPSPKQIHVAIVHKSLFSTLVKNQMESQLLAIVDYSGPATVTPSGPAWKGEDPTKELK